MLDECRDVSLRELCSLSPIIAELSLQSLIRFLMVMNTARGKYPEIDRSERSGVKWGSPRLLPKEPNDYGRWGSGPWKWLADNFHADVKGVPLGPDACETVASLLLQFAPRSVDMLGKQITKPHVTKQINKPSEKNNEKQISSKNNSKDKQVNINDHKHVPQNTDNDNNKQTNKTNGIVSASNKTQERLPSPQPIVPSSIQPITHKIVPRRDQALSMWLKHPTYLCLWDLAHALVVSKHWKMACDEQMRELVVWEREAFKGFQRSNGGGMQRVKSGVNLGFQRVKSTLGQGQEQSIDRTKCWLYLTSQLFHKDSAGQLQALFARLVGSGSSNAEGDFEPLIAADLPRTTLDHPLFSSEKRHQGEDLVRKVLTAFADFDSEVGYCQGMSSLAAVCVSVFGDGTRAYWAFVYLMRDLDLRSLFLPASSRLAVCVYQLDVLFRRTLPALHAHLAAEKVNTSQFAVEWFVGLFVGTLPYPLVLRVWDLFLVIGWRALFQTSLALLATFQEGLAKLQNAKIGRLLRTVANNPLWDLPQSLEQFMERVAGFASLATYMQLSELEADYHLIHRARLKRLSAKARTVVEELLQSDVLRTHRLKFKVHQSSISGTELVEWLLQHQHALNRRDAIDLGQTLFAYGLRPITEEAVVRVFQDDQQLYVLEPIPLSTPLASTRNGLDVATGLGSNPTRNARSQTHHQIRLQLIVDTVAWLSPRDIGALRLVCHRYNRHLDAVFGQLAVLPPKPPQTNIPPTTSPSNPRAAPKTPASSLISPSPKTPMSSSRASPISILSSRTAFSPSSSKGMLSPSPGKMDLTNLKSARKGLLSSKKKEPIPRSLPKTIESPPASPGDWSSRVTSMMRHDSGSW